MSIPVKEFVLTHVVEDIQQIINGKDQEIVEYHFGVPWRIIFYREARMLSFDFACIKPEDDWSIETAFEFKILSPKSYATCSKEDRCFSADHPSWRYHGISLAKLIGIYSKNEKVAVQINVKILKMTGCEKKKLTSFDDPELSDVVLIVGDKKFYMLKKFLARQSTYFKALLLGNFDESKQSEVVLKDIDSEDFQNFLELIHGESSIDDDTIDGILHLAEMYDAPTAIRRCEEYLMEKSKKAKEQKLQISIQYKLEKLKKQCLSEIKTVDEIRSAVNVNLDTMDISIAKALLQKSLSLH